MTDDTKRKDAPYEFAARLQSKMREEQMTDEEACKAAIESLRRYPEAELEAAVAYYSCIPEGQYDQIAHDAIKYYLLIRKLVGVENGDCDD